MTFWTQKPITKVIKGGEKKKSNNCFMFPELNSFRFLILQQIYINISLFHKHPGIIEVDCYIF